ncbi:MAG: PilZ domain-containing protein [Candidatus Omnitrophica bacterium]|nr:PilZ domain-containing protein [Candidatus Omnitrophota bacterium]MDD5592423.1 PilZ domain-containing protein [Candidatus Omnitrophota bacterium]
MFKDSRRFQRLALNTQIKFKQYSDYDRKIYLEDKEKEAVAIDISEGGLGIQTKTFIAAKTYLEIWISLSGLNQIGEVVFYGPIKVTGKVRWVVPWDDNTFRMGVSFLDMQEEDRKALSGFLNSHTGIQEKIIHQKDISSGTVLGDKRESDSAQSQGREYVVLSL